MSATSTSPDTTTNFQNRITARNLSPLLLFLSGGFLNFYLFQIDFYSFGDLFGEIFVYCGVILLFTYASVYWQRVAKRVAIWLLLFSPVFILLQDNDFRGEGFELALKLQSIELIGFMITVLMIPISREKHKQ